MNEDWAIRAEAELIRRETGQTRAWATREARRRLSLPALGDGPSYKRFRTSVSIKRSPELALMASRFDWALVAPALSFRRGYVDEDPVTEFAFQPRFDTPLRLIGRTDEGLEGWFSDRPVSSGLLNDRVRTWIEAWFASVIEELSNGDIFGHLLDDADQMLAQFEHNPNALCDLSTCDKHVVDDPEYYQVTADAWIGAREDPSVPEGYDIHHHEDSVTRITPYQWRTTAAAQQFGPRPAARPAGSQGGSDGLRVVAHAGENLDPAQAWFSRFASHDLAFAVPENEIPAPVRAYIKKHHAVQRDRHGSLRATVFRELLHALAGLPPFRGTVIPQTDRINWQPSKETARARGFTKDSHPVDDFLVRIPIPSLPASNLTQKILRFAPDIRLRVAKMDTPWHTADTVYVESTNIAGRPRAFTIDTSFVLNDASAAKTGLTHRQAEHLRGWLREAAEACIALRGQRAAMRIRIVHDFQHPLAISVPYLGEVDIDFDQLDRMVQCSIPLGRPQQSVKSRGRRVLSYDPSMETYRSSPPPLNISESLPGGEARGVGAFSIVGDDAADIQWLGSEVESGLSAADLDARQAAAEQVVMARACATEAEGLLLSAVMGLRVDL